jgi:hypothetical protein
MKHFIYLFICMALFSNPLFSQEEEKSTQEEAKLAQEEAKHPLLADKFWIEVGAFFPTKSLQIGADASLPDDEIDFHERFNMSENQITYFLDFEWRWNKKWRLTAESFSVYNASRATLDSTIVFDDTTFEKGTTVKAGIEFALIRVFVGRLISSGPKHSLGAGLGVHAMNLGAFVEGEIHSDNEELNGTFQRKRVSVLIPLPNIGAWYHWAPTEKWAFIARVDWFGINIDQFSGGLWDIAPGVRYEFAKHFGVGVDYRFFLLDASINNNNWIGSAGIDFSGPTITVNWNF